MTIMGVHRRRRRPCHQLPVPDRMVVSSFLVVCVFAIQYTMVQMFEQLVDEGYHRGDGGSKGGSRGGGITVTVSSSEYDNVNENSFGYEPDNNSPGSDGTSTTTGENHNHHDRRIPRRLISVFGLESSGTTFVFDTIREAMKLPHKVGDEAYNIDRSTMVQHVSLPTGSYFQQRYDENRLEEEFDPVVVPYAVPLECRELVGRPNKVRLPSHHNCQPYHTDFVIGSGQDRRHPTRYFVNITSHIEWYESRGTSVTTLIVVRDTSIHFQGVLQTHCKNETAAYEQYQRGLSIIQDAISFDSSRRRQKRRRRRKGNDGENNTGSNDNSSSNDNSNTGQLSSSLIIVSYETLMTLQNQYLSYILDQIGGADNDDDDVRGDGDGDDNDTPARDDTNAVLHSNFQPDYKNGNLKYVHLPDKLQRYLNNPFDTTQKTVTKPPILQKRSRTSGNDSSRQMRVQ